MIRAAAALLLVAATPAIAQDGPRFCPNRPSVGTSTCITDPGRVLVEASGVDWQRDGDATSILVGDLLLRTGIDDRTEAQVGWTPLSHLVSRENGLRTVATGTGDVRLGIRRNLRHPDGEGLSIAIEGFATLPTATDGLGRGDWSAGLVVPVSWEMGKWSLALTGEVDAETNASRTGRHPAGALTLGLGRDLADTVTAVVEVSGRRDDDPARAQTQVLTAASIAWEVRPRMQLDLLVAAGLDAQAPSLRIVLGGAVLF